MTKAKIVRRFWKVEEKHKLHTDGWRVACSSFDLKSGAEAYIEQEKNDLMLVDGWKYRVTEHTETRRIVK